MPTTTAAKKATPSKKKTSKRRASKAPAKAAKRSPAKKAKKAPAKAAKKAPARAAKKAPARAAEKAPARAAARAPATAAARVPTRTSVVSPPAAPAPIIVRPAPKGAGKRFKVGDKVVYPNHGVGIIEDVRKRAIAGEEATFYSLKILSTDTTVMVPVGNSEAVGLRKILGRKEVDTVLKMLKKNEVSLVNDWKGRYQENCEKMRTGSIDQVAEVLKDLTYLSSIKNLSYRERKMLDKARFLVVSELAEATSRESGEVEGQIDKAMAVSAQASSDH